MSFDSFKNFHLYVFFRQVFFQKKMFLFKKIFEIYSQKWTQKFKKLRLWLSFKSKKLLLDEYFPFNELFWWITLKTTFLAVISLFFKLQAFLMQWKKIVADSEFIKFYLILKLLNRFCLKKLYSLSRSFI